MYVQLCFTSFIKYDTKKNKGPCILFFMWYLTRDLVNIWQEMLTKGGAYLLTRTTSIDYTHKTVKHNTFRFSTVGYITI